MTAATILYLDETGEPGVEVVTLSTSDGFTFTSRKFRQVFGAVGCINDNSDQEMNITISGNTVTTNFGAAVSTATCTIKLFGHPVNYGLGI